MCKKISRIPCQNDCHSVISGAEDFWKRGQQGRPEWRGETNSP